MGILLTTYPPLLVHVVIECPLRCNVDKVTVDFKVKDGRAVDNFSNSGGALAPPEPPLSTAVDSDAK